MSFGYSRIFNADYFLNGYISIPWTWWSSRWKDDRSFWFKTFMPLYFLFGNFLATIWQWKFLFSYLFGFCRYLHVTFFCFLLLFIIHRNRNLFFILNFSNLITYFLICYIINLWWRYVSFILSHWWIRIFFLFILCDVKIKLNP